MLYRQNIKWKQKFDFKIWVNIAVMSYDSNIIKIQTPQMCNIDIIIHPIYTN